MEISLFKKLFSSLSQISPASFEIWNDEGPVFSSNPDEKNHRMFDPLSSLSARFVHRQKDSAETLLNHMIAVGVPIQNREKTMGALIAYWDNGKSNSAPEMKTFLFSLAEIIEGHLISQNEVEKITAELSQNFENLYLYSTIGTQVNSLHFSNAMLNVLVEQVLDTMRADMAFAIFPDRQSFNAIFNHSVVHDKISDLNSFTDALLNSIPLDAPSIKENYFIVHNSGEIPEFFKLSPYPYRFLGVKIQSHDQFYGWLGLVSFNLNEIFQRGEMRLLISVAEQVAAVINNTDLYNDLERFGINMVKSLVYAIEAKDQYTRGHAERVNRYCLLMGEALNMTPKERNILGWTSILHDIGKIGIPENILNKPAALTDQEYEIIKRHPEKGCDIIKPLEQLSELIPGILHHHENYDGTGYPDGLVGKDIPYLARIISVADTFDAINSDRAYRAATPPVKVLEIIDELSGSQLDPAIAKIFREIVITKIINKK